MAKEKDENIL